MACWTMKNRKFIEIPIPGCAKEIRSTIRITIRTGYPSN
jgi:hypothetical protein